MELKELVGLPAHPLVVHAAVVLVPVAAVVTILAVVVTRWRARLALVGAVLGVLAFGAVWLAIGSGEELEERVDETELVEEHAELGDTMLPIAGLLAVGNLAVGGVELTRRRGRTVASALVIGASLLGLTGAVVSTVQVARVGHSGAKATWNDVDEEGER